LALLAPDPRECLANVGIDGFRVLEGTVEDRSHGLPLQCGLRRHCPVKSSKTYSHGQNHLLPHGLALFRTNGAAENCKAARRPDPATHHHSLCNTDAPGQSSTDRRKASSSLNVAPCASKRANSSGARRALSRACTRSRARASFGWRLEPRVSKAASS